MDTRCQLLVPLKQRGLSLVFIIGLILWAPSSWAQTPPPATPPLPAGDCPTPHNSCVAACGTYCTYWTCNDPKIRPDFWVNQLPYKWVWWENNSCTGRVGKEENLYKIKQTYTFGPAGKTQTHTIDRLPYGPIKLDTWACLQHNDGYGGCCGWNTTPWSACSAVCSGGDTASGTQTRSVSCPAPNGDCCGGAPASSRACSVTCLPAPSPVAGSIGPDNFGPTQCQGDGPPSCFWNLPNTDPWNEASIDTGYFVVFDQDITVANSSLIKACQAGLDGANDTLFQSQSNVSCPSTGLCYGVTASTSGKKLTAYDTYGTKPHSLWISFFVPAGAVKNAEGRTNTTGFCFTIRTDD